MYAGTLKPVTQGCKGTTDCFIPRNFCLLSNLRALSGYTEQLILLVKFSVVTELQDLYRVNFILFLGELQLEKSIQAGFLFFCLFFIPWRLQLPLFCFPSEENNVAGYSRNTVILIIRDEVVLLYSAAQRYWFPLPLFMLEELIMVENAVMALQ